MLGIPSHGLTNIFTGTFWVLTLSLRLCAFPCGFSEIGGVDDVSAWAEVARVRLHHSALHGKMGDAVRPREVIIRTRYARDGMVVRTEGVDRTNDDWCFVVT